MTKTTMWKDEDIQDALAAQDGTGGFSPGYLQQVHIRNRNVLR